MGVLISSDQIREDVYQASWSVGGERGPLPHPHPLPHQTSWSVDGEALVTFYDSVHGPAIVGGAALVVGVWRRAARTAGRAFATLR